MPAQRDNSWGKVSADTLSMRGQARSGWSRRYWSYTDLETMARKALMAPPLKSELTDAQIREIVLNILNHNKAEMDWWLMYLEINTGLDNLTDYIFWPDLVGLSEDSDLEEIAYKIILDRR